MRATLPLVRQTYFLNSEGETAGDFQKLLSCLLFLQDCCNHILTYNCSEENWQWCSTEKVLEIIS